MRRMKQGTAGQSNQVLRHPIRSCYGMILQACEGNKEKSICNSEYKYSFTRGETLILERFWPGFTGDGINQ
jgi:hypothetical protein